MAKWNFFATNSSLIKELDTSGDDVNPQSQSFLAPTLDLQGAKIVFKEGGLYKTALLFTEIGTIDGVNPVNLQDAYDKIIALIPNSSGPTGSQTLQQVTDEGNTTTNDIIVSKATGSSVIQVVNGDDALTFQVDSFGSLIELNDVTDAEYGSIRLGEIVMQAVDASIQLTYNYFGLSNNNAKPYIELSGSDGILTGSVSIKTDLVNGTYEQQLPSKSGTFAMLDDILDWTSVVKHTVKNNGAGLISKGTAVYVTGSNGTNMLVGKASNASEATSSKTMGLMQSDITTTGGTQTGFVVTEGLLEGLNTASATAGDPVWLGVNGALIYGLANKPYAPAHLVFIGIVTKVSAGNGEIFVKVQNGFELKEIHDVDLVSNSPTNNQGLVYETATSLWKNKTIIEDAIVDSVTDKAPSQNAVFDALALKQNSSTLIFDSLQKAIMRDNYFWFIPAAITLGAGGYAFGTSERISGAAFAYLNNGALVRGMLSFNTTIVPGILAFSRRNDALILTSLEVIFTRKIQFNSNVSGQRFFCGISKGNQFVAPTNVEPNTLTDIVGICQLSTSTNMHVVYNDASGTATTIDLGSSYPCTDSQYNYYITIEQTTTSYIVTVERVTIVTGVSISTANTLTTNIPNYATGVIQPLVWISNNASAAIASYLDGGGIGNVKNQ